MGWKYNPFTKKLDETGGGGGGAVDLSDIEGAAENYIPVGAADGSLEDSSMKADGDQLIVPAGSASNPSLAIDETNTGLYLSGANTLGFTAGGVGGRWTVTSQTFGSAVSGAPKLRFSIATSTTPNIHPNSADLDSGVGQNAVDEVSIIAGGNEILRIIDSGKNVRFFYDATHYNDIATDSNGYLKMTSSDGTVKIEGRVTLVDDATVSIGTIPTNGCYGLVYCDQGSGADSGQMGLFRCSKSGNLVSTQAATSLLTNDDTDGYLCIYNSGDTLILKNRLGSTRECRFEATFLS